MKKLPILFKKDKTKSKKPVFLLVFLILLSVLLPHGSSVFADDGSAEDGLAASVKEIIDSADLSAIEEFLASMDESQRGVFGSGSILDKVQRIVSGEVKMDYGSFLSYVLEVAGLNVLKYLPLISAILAIVVAFGILSSLKPQNASDSVEGIVGFASVALVVALVLTQAAFIMGNVASAVGSMQKQMNVVFPVILTMMAASGAASSAAVYQPSVAILAGGIMQIVTVIVLPMFIFSSVFTVVGNISGGVKLKKMSDFFSSSAKWLLGTAFFVFGAFLSVQGITASVYDGVSVRTAKFAVSKYVPVIGGYLSDGLSLVMAGSVLVKNAVGMTAVVLLFLTVVPLLAQIIIFQLSLSLAAAIAEPLGGEKISAILSGLAKNIGLLTAVVLGTAFMYFIFLILTISTGNLIL